MVEGGMKCIKYLLFGFNLLFFLAGLGLIIAGAVVQAKLNTYLDFFGEKFSAAAILLIVVGVVIFIIGFFGCCGAYKENYCMTMTFAVLLGIIFLLEIAAGIAAYVMRNEVKSFVQDKLKTSIPRYNITGSKGVTDTWDLAQRNFKCCGVTNATDWKDNPSLSLTQSVPDSCCAKKKWQATTCGLGALKPGSTEPLYQEGCIKKFEYWVQSNIYIIGGVGIGLAFVQLVGIIFACCLARTIKKEYEVV